MPTHESRSVDQLKRDAARLLKSARSGDASAVARLRRLDNPPAQPQLKHALTVVAQEAGHAGWTEAKAVHDGGLDFSTFFARPGLGDTLNAWFTGHDEASAHRASTDGVLLPYRHQVFVTSKSILGRMGFEPDHPDWQAIGYDFAKPASTEAHGRIKVALQRRFGAHKEA